MKNKILTLSMILLLPMVSHAASVDTVMSTKNLGKPLKTLGLGVSPQEEYGVHSYKINGCAIDVEVKADPNKTIESISIASSAACQGAQLSEVFQDKKRPGLVNLTFGQLTSVLGAPHYTADCLTLCGNAYNPSMYASWGVFSAEVVLVDDQSIDASINWGKAISKKYDQDYVIDNRFNCTKEFDALAAQEFKDVKISKLTLRAVQTPPECTGK